jgi:hypothetical protein
MYVLACLKTVGSEAAITTHTANMAHAITTDMNGDVVIKGVLCSSMIASEYEGGKIFGIRPYFKSTDGLEGMLISQIRSLMGEATYRVGTASTDNEPKEFPVSGTMRVRGMPHQSVRELKDLDKSQLELVGSVDVRFHNVSVDKMSRFSFGVFIIKYESFTVQPASDMYSFTRRA